MGHLNLLYQYFLSFFADIDECMEDYPCPSNSICVNTIGNYSCSCKSGFRAIKADSGSTSENCIGKYSDLIAFVISITTVNFNEFIEVNTEQIQ